MGDINKQRPDLVQKGWSQGMWDARNSEDWFTKAMTTDDDWALDRYKRGQHKEAFANSSWLSRALRDQANTGRGNSAPQYKGQTLPYPNQVGMDPSQTRPGQVLGAEGTPEAVPPGSSGSAGAAPVDQEAQRQAELDKQIDEFYKQMQAPLDQNDPDVQMAMKDAAQVANQEAARRGLDGGIVASEAGRMAGAASDRTRTQKQQFRQGLGFQALGLKNQRQSGLADLGERRYQYDTNRADDFARGEYSNARADAAAAAERQQQLFSAIGAGLGGIAGSYTGMGSQAGSQFGAGIGSGLGGLSGPRYPSAPRPSGRRGSSSGRGY